MKNLTDYIATDPSDSTRRDDIIGLLVGIGGFFVFFMLEYYIIAVLAVVWALHSVYFLYARNEGKA